MSLRRLLPLFLIVVAAGCRVGERISAPVSATGGTETLSADAPLPDQADGGRSGAVYVMTNAPAGNAVLAFQRSRDGILSGPSSYATGGVGTGAGLGNQAGVVLSPDGEWLFVVNAGSNEISSFEVRSHGLRLVDRVASGGIRPVSIAVHRHLLFVLNAGGDGNISGFRIRHSGRLAPIRNATRPLSSNAAMAAQVGFTPDGEHLVVTERATGKVTVYTVDDDGEVRGPRPYDSSGTTPFGFGFTGRGALVVSEAFGGAAGASAVSSYRLGESGRLRVVSPSVPTTQTAACWIAISDDSRFAYSTNAGSATITGYRIASGGALTRLQADGITATTGAGPSDLAFGRDGRFLYVRSGGSSSISAYVWHRDGSLEPIAGATGLPNGTNGLAAR